MTTTETNDFELLIDFLLGQCDEQTAEKVRRRIASDADFRRQHDDLAATFAAVRLVPDVEAPRDLVDRTVARVRQYERTNDLLAREQVDRGARRPTFSLRELTTVAAVMLVLIGSFALWRHSAGRHQLASLCRNRMQQIGTGMKSHIDAHDGALPAAGADGRWLQVDGAPIASNSAALFKLVAGGYVSPSAFRCPGVEDDATSPVFQYRQELNDFPDGKDISYSYQHSIGRPGLKLPAAPQTMVILADASPLFQKGLFVRESLVGTPRDKLASPNHGRSGQNILRGDMHVDWAESASVGIDRDNIYLAGNDTHYDGTEMPVNESDTFLLPSYTPLSASMP